MRLILTILLLLTSIHYSVAQIGEKVPRKGRTNEYYFSLKDDYGQQWLLKSGSTKVTVKLKGKGNEETIEKGVFKDMNQTTLSLDNWIEIKMSDIETISFKPSVNHSGNLLAAYYFAYTGTVIYLISIAGSIPTESSGTFLYGVIIIAPILAIVPLLFNQILTKHPKITLQPVGDKFNRLW